MFHPIANCAKNADMRLKNENWDTHGNFSKEGKLNDKLQSYIKAECEEQKREIRKRLNEPFPNEFVDEETPNHNLNPRNLYPILIKYSIMSISY